MLDIHILLSVLDPLSILYAFLSGFTTGATLLLYFSLRFPARTDLSGLQQGAIISVLTMIVGLIFFAGQTTQAFLSDDPFWPRILGRFALWLLFSLALGAGLHFARSFAGRANRL